ncbi:cytochrome P450 [Jannaschia sp. CCS1]|uniref:cytochrome P450 n=1 Tax=Jannaschia sp. (strain CCS1) TaxID=290400 RepID=UPI000053AFDD|nr:cytochrome P450 [Jannaschia sp. CCS1]ABD56650.1 cytochrome P450 family protein [Jannaschia sp. CCS1]
MNKTYDIDPKAFWRDPYPDLARIQAQAPAVFVPQLGATLLTRRDDIFEQEKRIEVFSSEQPGGLMTMLMGENLMRKDGDAHMAERKVIFPALSPRVVKATWKRQFEAATNSILDALEPQGHCDLVTDFAMPVCGEALKVITGLTQMPTAEMDRVSQHMLDGCANYVGDNEVEARCHAATAFIDEHIDLMVPELIKTPDASVLSVQLAAGLPMASTRANVKLVISGGQNEPRDAIAGTAWALLAHGHALAKIAEGSASFLDAFEEYARLISPIGMSPRQVARSEHVLGHDFEVGDRVFLMFGAANRDPRIFEAPDVFDITRNNRKSVTFGAGPHFCAGAAASRALIAEVALPKLFERLPRLRLDGGVTFGGWAFRGPLKVPVRWF